MESISKVAARLSSLDEEIERVRARLAELKLLRARTLDEIERLLERSRT